MRRRRELLNLVVLADGDVAVCGGDAGTVGTTAVATAAAGTYVVATPGAKRTSPGTPSAGP